MKHEDNSPNSAGVSRRDFLQNAMAGAAMLSLGDFSFSSISPADRDTVLAQIAAQHDATRQDAARLDRAAVHRRREPRTIPQGAEYMAKLARDAGFQHVEVVPTAGKPGVFATLDAGAQTTLAHLLHVRREAVRSRRVELAAARRRASSTGRASAR